MANININDLSALNLTGAELFDDSESFMTELSDESEQMEEIYGGASWWPWPICIPTSCREVSCLRKTFINAVK
ncbi:hypothetical protein BJP34_13225 [Moorena producens PAL-8-15-08-1]|uniref:Uncharacterized protein n=1 Tax=Moorena producens PAL-8-15-08-1 TaxID=1458985 RepID=A0A1D8TRM7_9CYAN|nr:hypothetical protein [Moorena producens]AOX00290.1 hypothetical protein BJP34_13225 [Moorena producens PAL-8-15-08-1]